MAFVFLNENLLYNGFIQGQNVYRASKSSKNIFSEKCLVYLSQSLLKTSEFWNNFMFDRKYIVIIDKKTKKPNSKKKWAQQGNDVKEKGSNAAKNTQTFTDGKNFTSSDKAVFD
jgi:hypothetical protein